MYCGVRLSCRILQTRRWSATPELATCTVWPTYLSTFIHRPQEADSGDEAVPEREAVAGSFGLILRRAKDTKIARQIYNVRSETVAEKPSFRDA